MYKIIIVLSLSFLSLSAFSQVVKLTEQEKEKFQKRTLEKINEFQAQLSIIASKDTDSYTKKIYSEGILDLFINKGEKPDPCPGSGSCDPVIMEVSSTRTNSKKRIPVKAYLSSLAKLEYSKVVVTAAKSCHVSSLYEKGKDEFGNPIYAATATYYQEFVGFIDGKPAYRDVTQKIVEVEVRHTTDLEGSRWIILLGDVSVKDTTS